MKTTSRPLSLQLSIPVILASASPRRHDLLNQLGIAHQVVPSHADESIADTIEYPPEVVSFLARMKAEHVSASHPDALVIGADTVVVHDGSILGKPKDKAETARMIGSLSGQTHVVHTGLCLTHRNRDRTIVEVESTEVHFANLSPAEISAYAATGSSLDKAGGYGIQDEFGAVFVKSVSGDFYNVMGLPLHRLYEMLKAHFADIIHTG